MGEGPALIHLDLHLASVLLGPRGPAVIDWPHARRGAGEADVAMTWIILAASDLAAVRRVLPLLAERRLRDRNVRERERSRVRRLARL